MRTQHWLYTLGLSACLALPLLAAAPAAAQGRDREADLSVEIVSGPRRARAGDVLRFTVEVTNNGPDTARDVSVRATGSEELFFVRTRCRAVVRRPDECIFREIEPDESVLVTFVVDVEESVRRRARAARFRVRVDSATFDPEPEDNTERRTIRIVGRGGGRRGPGGPGPGPGGPGPGPGPGGPGPGPGGPGPGPGPRGEEGFSLVQPEPAGQVLGEGPLSAAEEQAEREAVRAEEARFEAWADAEDARVEAQGTEASPLPPAP